MGLVKKKLASILTVTLSCLIGFIFFELGLRAVNSYNPWHITKEVNILRNIQFTYDVSELYPSDLSNVDYVRNEYGLRDNCINPDQVEILTIGGSTTDQRYISLKSTYQTRIQQRLKDIDNEFGCVSNAGVDGHSSLGHLFAFEHWFPLVPKLKPKFTLLYIGINDADFRRAKMLNSDFEQQNKIDIKDFLISLDVVKAFLPIYHLIKQSFSNSSAAYVGHVPRLYEMHDFTIKEMNEETIGLSKINTEAFKSRMIKLIDEIRELNSTPICVTQPHRYVMELNGQLYGIPNIMGEGFSGIDYDFSINQLNAVMFELCGKNILDLYNYSFLASHFYDGVHTTASGSQVIGDRMADFIIENFY
jgi:lysophospholipase L1-like esterase